MSKLALNTTFQLTKSQLERSFATPKEYLDHAIALHEANKYSEAIEYYNQAERLALQSKSPDYDLISLASVNKADAVGMLGRDEDCLRILDEAIEYSKKVPDGEYDVSNRMGKKASKFIDLERFDEAISLCNKAILICPSEKAYRYKAFSLKAKGVELEKKGFQKEADKFFAKALGVVREGIEECPEDNLYFELGRCLHASGNHKEAIQAYDKFLAIGGTVKMMTFYSAKANAYVKLGDYKEALKCLKETKKLFEQEGQYLTVYQANDIKASLSQEGEVIDLLSRYIDTISDQDKSEPYEMSLNNKVSKNASDLFNSLVERKKSGESTDYACEQLVLEQDQRKEFKQDIKYIKVRAPLYEYYFAFFSTMTSYFASAKAADGKQVGTKESDGIPFLKKLGELIPISEVQAAIKLANLPIKLYHDVNRTNEIRYTVASASSISDFEDAIKIATAKICRTKEQVISRVSVDTAHIFGLLDSCYEITEMVYYNRFKTGAQKLALQHSVIGIGYVNSGHLKLSIDSDDFVEDVKGFVMFVSDQKVESSIVKALSNGYRLKLDKQEHKQENQSKYGDGYHTEEHSNMDDIHHKTKLGGEHHDNGAGCGCEIM